MSGGGFQVVQNTRPAIRLAHAFQIFRSRFAMSQKLTVNDFKARAVPGLAEVHGDLAGGGIEVRPHEGVVGKRDPVGATDIDAQRRRRVGSAEVGRAVDHQAPGDEEIERGAIGHQGAVRTPSSGASRKTQRRGCGSVA